MFNTAPSSCTYSSFSVAYLGMTLLKFILCWHLSSFLDTQISISFEFKGFVHYFFRYSSCHFHSSSKPPMKQTLNILVQSTACPWSSGSFFHSFRLLSLGNMLCICRFQPWLHPPPLQIPALVACTHPYTYCFEKNLKLWGQRTQGDPFILSLLTIYWSWQILDLAKYYFFL